MTDKKLNCNFCGKGRDQVDKLIAGPNVYICNECISISYEILVDDTHLLPEDTSVIPTPREIHNYLNEYVTGQEETKEILSTSAYNHYKRINHISNNDVTIEKSNVLMIGPTGSGKTLIAKTLAKKLNVPFAIADATTLTEAGYVGDDVEAVLERLLAVADYDVERAQKGIIFIDEIDKKSRKSESSTTTRDVSGEGVQQAMLRLIEGTVTKIKLGTKKLTDEYVEFDTSNTLFIVGGAFVGIEDFITKRLKNKTGVGFTGNVISKDQSDRILKILQPSDVVKYGLIPELVGRLPIITTLDTLSEDQLVEIMSKMKNSVIDQVKELMIYNEIELEFSNTYYIDVAKRASSTGMGARAVKSIVENSLFYLMYNAPELQEDNVIKVIFDKYPSRIEKPMAVYANGESKRIEDYRFFRSNTLDTAK
jgi:ATP-dependent Clp protease ATP-binding subunit ClpX